MSNSKLFLLVLLIGAAIGFWYWGRENPAPETPAKPAVPEGIKERAGADPFPAESKK